MRTRALLAITLAVVACSSSSDSGNNGGGTGGTSIGAAGGTVTSSDGKVKLTIPAGALPRSVSFSVTPDTATPGTGSALVPGSVYDFEPTGTTFAVPATIRMTYQPSQLPVGTDPLFLSVYQRDGSTWDSIPSTLDTVAHTITASVSHFTDYGACAGPCVVPFTGRLAVNFYPGCCVVLPVGGQVAVKGAIEWNNRQSGGVLQLGSLPAGISGGATLGAISPGCPEICTAPVNVTLYASSAAVPGQYTVVVNLLDGGTVVAAGSIPLAVTAVPGFTLATAPASLLLTQGGSAITTVSITRTNFTPSVSLSATTLPTGVTASFAPATLSGDTLSSVVTFTATNAVPSGSSSAVIHATGAGAPDQSDTVTLVVAPFAVAVVPASAIVTTGGSTKFAVKVTRSSGFVAPVTLAVSGLPTGASGSFASTSVADSSTLTIIAAAGVVTGSYPLQVVATAGAVTQQVSVTLQVAHSGGAYALDFSSCFFTPAWVAFQDSTGPWTPVSASSGVYQLPTPTSQHVGFAFVFQYQGSYNTAVYYVSPAELSQIASTGAQCGAPPFPGFQTLNGIAAGTDSAAGALGFIGMGGGVTAVRSDGPFGLSIAVGTSGPYAVTGYFERTESYLSDSDLVLINRNVSSPGVVNFAAGTTVAADSATVLGGTPGDHYSVNMYYGAQAQPCQTSELYAWGTSSPTFLLTGMPASLQLAGDLHELDIGDAHTSDGRDLTAYFHTLPPTMMLTLGSLLTPTITALTTPYKRLSLTLPSLPGDYTTVSMDAYQQGGADEYVVATRSYVGNGAVSLTMPDFSTVGGFSSAWEPGVSATVSTEIAAASPPITGSQCSDGVTVKSVYVDGTN